MNKIDNNTVLDKYKEISKLNIEEVYTKYRDIVKSIDNNIKVKELNNAS